MWIFLDDKRSSPLVVHNNERGLGPSFGKSTEWVYARNYNEFVDIVEKNFDQIDLISFDHDIDSWIDVNGVPVEMTGKTAAQFIIDYCMDNGKELPDWFVHSDNIPGNRNIRSLLMGYMYSVEGRVSSIIDAFGYVDNKIHYLR